MAWFKGLPDIGLWLRQSRDYVDCQSGRVLRFDKDSSRLKAITRLRDICIPYSETVALSGASVTITDLIPAGTALLGGVTSLNLTAVSGATGYQLGIPGALDLFGFAIPGTADYESDITDWLASNMVYYQSATSVILTAIGGNFTAGQAEVTAWGLPH